MWRKHINMRKYSEYSHMVIINDDYECWYLNRLFGEDVGKPKKWNKYYRTDAVGFPGALNSFTLICS